MAGLLMKIRAVILVIAAVVALLTAVIKLQSASSGCDGCVPPANNPPIVWLPSTDQPGYADSYCDPYFNPNDPDC
jgi:uncharacterized Zn-finger protein